MKPTVEQLIKKLQEYPKNYEVKVLDQSGYYLCLYYNIRPDGYFYKPIYWCEKRKKNGFLGEVLSVLLYTTFKL